MLGGYCDPNRRHVLLLKLSTIFTLNIIVSPTYWWLFVVDGLDEN